MNKPITLWRPEYSVSSDEAATTILKSVLPRPYVPGSYESHSPVRRVAKRKPIPSLAYFCIKRLVESPEDIVGVTRIPYVQSDDLLRALVPNYGTARFAASEMHPRLWATLIQLYDSLPSDIRHYSLPLSDMHVPYFQSLPSTPEFTLVTTLSLPGCVDLNDDTIVALKALHTLSAIDASWTSLSARGIKSFAGTLTWTDGQEREKRGPWGLRILNLRACSQINNAIFDCLDRFPLLSVVDLRGTRCVWNSQLANSCQFQLSSNESLYYPSLLSATLNALSALTPQDSETSTSAGLFSSQEQFYLNINHLHHPDTTQRGFPTWGTYTKPPGENEGEIDAEYLTEESQEEGSQEEDSQKDDADDQDTDAWGFDDGSDRTADDFISPEPEDRPLTVPASRFYSTSSTRPYLAPRSLPETSTNNHLTLYRPPPPWSSLERIESTSYSEQKKLKRERQDDEIMEVRREDPKAQGGVKALWGMIAKRRRLDEDVDASPKSVGKREDSDHAPSRSTSNPFKKAIFAPKSSSLVPARHPTATSTPIPTPGPPNPEPSSSRPARAVANNGDSEPERRRPYTLKPLKPISTLPIPPLPASHRPPPPPPIIPMKPKPKSSSSSLRQARLDMAAMAASVDSNAKSRSSGFKPGENKPSASSSGALTSARKSRSISQLQSKPHRSSAEKPRAKSPSKKDPAMSRKQ